MSDTSNNGQIRRPTFLFIGAARCGSKTLHKFFQQHPDCYVPPIADPYFFDQNFERGLNWYWSLFAPASPNALALGEFSHDYIHSKIAAERIASLLPDVKLLATLRHPVDRTFSSYASASKTMLIRGSFEEALEKVPRLVEHSMYAEGLQNYVELFGRDRIKIMLFDELKADPKAFATQAFEFVGLSPQDGIDYSVRMGALTRSRWPMSGPISKVAAITLRKLGWVVLLGRLKGNPRFRALFRTPYQENERPQMAPETRRKLNALFAPEIDRLESLLDRDLSHWRT